MANTAPTAVSFAGELRLKQPNGNILFPKTADRRLSLAQAFTSGTAAAQVNRVVVQEFTIPGSAALTIDLAAGTWDNTDTSGDLLDLNNAQVTFTKIKGLAVVLVSETGGSDSVVASFLDGAVAGPLLAQQTDGGWAGGLVWWDASAAGQTVGATTTTVTNGGGGDPATVIVGIAGLA